MFKIYCYVFGEIFKQMWKVRNLLACIGGGIFGLAVSAGIIWAYLNYKISLGANFYIDNIFLKFAYENNEILKLVPSKLFMVLTSCLGCISFIKLPWFKLKINLDEEKLDKMFDEVYGDDTDDDLW